MQNINENEENILSYSRVLIKKGNIHGKSRLFRSGSSEAIFREHNVFHKVQWPKDSSVSTRVIFLTSYLLKYITLSPDAMNKPLDERFKLIRNNKKVLAYKMQKHKAEKWLTAKHS